MLTRARTSSPCRLLVAEASAASSARKIISLLTPFSLETASTTRRISLLICFKLRTGKTPSALSLFRVVFSQNGVVIRHQPRFCDIVKTQDHLNAILLERNRLFTYSHNRPLKLTSSVLRTV